MGGHPNFDERELGKIEARGLVCKVQGVIEATKTLTPKPKNYVDITYLFPYDPKKVSLDFLMEIGSRDVFSDKTKMLFITNEARLWLFQSYSLKKQIIKGVKNCIKDFDTDKLYRLWNAAKAYNIVTFLKPIDVKKIEFILTTLDSESII